MFRSDGAPALNIVPNAYHGRFPAHVKWELKGDGAVVPVRGEGGDTLTWGRPIPGPLTVSQVAELDVVLTPPEE